jgi:hypothetical protein
MPGEQNALGIFYVYYYKQRKIYPQLQAMTGVILSIDIR